MSDYPKCVVCKMELIPHVREYVRYDRDKIKGRVYRNVYRPKRFCDRECSVYHARQKAAKRRGETLNE